VLPAVLRIPDVPFDLVAGLEPVLLDHPGGNVHVAGRGEKRFRPSADEPRATVGHFQDTE
jgi:hypothetical protein